MINRSIFELMELEAPNWEEHARNALNSGLVALTTNTGFDHACRILGKDLRGESGTATAATATTLTTNSTRVAATDDLKGHIVVTTAAAIAIGNIISNTSGANSVLTIDLWRAPNLAGTYDPTAPATVPTNTTPYVILPGGTPAFYMGISVGAVAPGATDTMLATALAGTTPQESWASGGGLNRAECTYAHTIGTKVYTLSNLFTVNANDAASTIVNKIGIFAHTVPKVTGPTNGNTGAQPTSATSGVMLFTTAVASAPTVINGDTVTITDTVTLS